MAVDGGHELEDAPVYGVRAPRQERSRVATSRILDAVTRMLATRTFDEISVRDICLEADVSPSTFYARFRTKDAVLHALFEPYRSTADAMRRQFATLDVVGDPARSVAILVRAYHRFLTEQYGLRRALERNDTARVRNEIINAETRRLAGVLLRDSVGPVDRASVRRSEYVLRAAHVLIENVVDRQMEGDLPGQELDEALEDVTDMLVRFTELIVERAVSVR